MIPSIISMIEEVSSPIDDRRRTAEGHLITAIKYEGFWASLMSIATDLRYNCESKIDVSFSASIIFKNIVTNNWKIIQRVHADDSVI